MQQIIDRAAVAPVTEPRDFTRWYEEEHRRVYASMLALCGDRELAADVAADAFAKALVSWRRVSAMERPGGWVYQVALNLLRRRLGRRTREAEVMRPMRSVVAPAADATRLDVWAQVRVLPDRQRHAIVLRYVADLTEPEIASVLGVSRGTVASNLFDARRSLAEALGPEFGPDAAGARHPEEAP